MGNTKKCPYCAEEILDEAIKCRYCGSDLRVPPLPPSPPDDDLFSVVAKKILSGLFVFILYLFGCVWLVGLDPVVGVETLEYCENEHLPDISAVEECLSIYGYGDDVNYSELKKRISIDIVKNILIQVILYGGMIIYAVVQVFRFLRRVYKQP